MLPLANQRPSTSGTPRPLGYMKESALGSSGHWHNKDSGSARRINFFFDFSLYFLRRNNGRHTSWLWFGYLCQGPEGEEAGRGEGKRQRCCHQWKGERGERRARRGRRG